MKTAIQDVTVEKPNVNFQKEHCLHELMRVLKTHADVFYVYALLMRVQQTFGVDSEMGQRKI